MIDTIFEQEAAKLIYFNKSEFESYVHNKQKLQAVKALKDYTGRGLKECKDIMDVYFDGTMKSYITEERRCKLETLAKKPLVEELIDNLKTLSKDDLEKFLMGFTVSELLDIDDKIHNL